ncbi:HesA/MoeB/ThiF family protein [Neolewinella aurantiaca]|uniref:HesA/MoeB/ThiF family protein n=1 Tax=Neolewinella aurantiaca TaxID=2602767 RepID=A0A5C7FHN6_9BACT|nr:HesA/MoeB/ThiF family protein [Neolewinella aurantiaca]TXF90734.1 HesA/MoeB/ThiF family protein [Neolewinella aurantiaca]
MNRYQRQTVLPEVGEAGQQKLATSHVLIIGCGGLGGPVAAYLAGAGVGTLTLVDGDSPEESNLHRQVFFRTGATDNKAKLLAEHCSLLNPGTRVRAHESYLEAGNAKALIEAADLVVECSDHALTKHLVSDACHLLGKPLVYAAVHKYEGYLAVFPNEDRDDLHLRDLFPAPDPTLPDCATVGALPTAVGLIAMMQANAALCYLLQIGTPPVRQLLTYNALDNHQHRLKLKKNYTQTVPEPWKKAPLTRAELETDATLADLADYDLVFSMLDEQREPELPEGVIRLTKRNPFGQCLERMEAGGKYLIYCNSGKLSLMLASQIRKHDASIEALSLRTGKPV